MSPNCVLMFFHRHKYRADGVRYCTYVLSSRNNEDGSMNVAEDKNKTNVITKKTLNERLCAANSQTRFELYWNSS